MTPHRQLANRIAIEKFGYPLAEWVYDQREAGKSWQTIAAELSQATDSVIDVSWETLRRWHT